MLRVAFGVFVGESLAVCAYVLNSQNGSHRLTLGAMAVSSVIAASLTVLLLPWIARQAWREQFSLAWTVLAGITLTGAVLLDGGLESPLLFLILLPAAYAGFVFRPVAAAACAVISLTEVVTIAVAEGAVTRRDDRLLLAASVCAGLGVLSWLSSVHRARLDRRFAALTHDLEVLASTDHLTGCLNHGAFNERLDDEIDRALRYGYPLSLVVADVDDFKRVNDTHGHPAGDTALNLAGTALRTRSRSTDVVGRIGGDEFALLLPGIPLDAAAQFTRRVFGPYGAGIERLTFSAGVASLDPAEPTSDHLFREADRALYHVKRGGGHGFAVSAPSGEPTRMPRDIEQGVS